MKRFLEWQTVQKTSFSWASDIKENSLSSFPIKMSSTILTFMYFPSCMILGYYLITLSKKIWNRNHFQIRMWENTVYKIRMFWLLAFKTPAHWFSEQKIMLKFEMKIKLVDSNIATQKTNLFSCEWLWFQERKKTNLLTTSTAI